MQRGIFASDFVTDFKMFCTEFKRDCYSSTFRVAKVVADHDDPYKVLEINPCRLKF